MSSEALEQFTPQSQLAWFLNDEDPKSGQCNLIVPVRITAELNDDGSPLVDAQGDVSDFDGYVRALQSWDGRVTFDHTDYVIGKLLGEIYADEDERAIYAAFEIWDPLAIHEVRRGWLNGVSHRGPVATDDSGKPIGYVEEVQDGRTVRRLVEFNVRHISLVHRPANPKAVVLTSKSSGLNEPMEGPEMRTIFRSPATPPTETNKAADGSILAQRAGYLRAAQEAINAAIKLGAAELTTDEASAIESMADALCHVGWLAAGAAADAAAEAPPAAPAAAAPAADATASDEGAMPAADGDSSKSKDGAVPSAADFAKLTAGFANLSRLVESMKSAQAPPAPAVPAEVQATLKQLADGQKALAETVKSVKADVDKIGNEPAINLPPRNMDSVSDADLDDDARALMALATRR